jgi:mxaA protein
VTSVSARKAAANTRRFAVVAACLAATQAAGAEPDAALVVEQPRAFGHFLGDRLQQRILLERRGISLQPIALPPAERLGVWIERLAARSESDAAGHSWLIVDYQIVNSAPTPTSVLLPAWQLKAASSGGNEVLAIPPWTIHVAPLTPSAAPTAESLSADRPAPPIAIEPIALRLQICLAALLTTMSSWLAWLLWRRQSAAAQEAFALAWRQMRRLPPSDPAAWYALHRAFDRSAGRAVQAASLDRLFQTAPHFAPARAEIAAFFALSEARFFSAGSTVEAMDLAALCRKLRRLERRRQR